VSKVNRKPEDLIGKRFGNNLELQVLFIGDRKCMKDTQFIVKCDVCAADPELYGCGLFTAKINSIDGNKYPCGCGRSYMKSKEQYEVLIKRFCADKGYEFIEFVGEFKGADSTVSLRCKKDGTTWTKWLSNLWQGANCPSCGKKKMAATLTLDEDRVNRELLSTGKFLEGTTFRRTTNPDEHMSVWYVNCPSCSKDGKEFRTRLFALRRGSVSCLCRPSGGFDKSKDGYFYVLRAVANDREFCGYGITTKINRRVSTHRRKLLREGFTLTEIESFLMSGVEAIELEKAVKSSFPIVPQCVEGFVTEATHYWLYDDVVAYVEDYTSKI
jgi:predicted GIY-YIG superfamily endonuclease